MKLTKDVIELDQTNHILNLINKYGLEKTITKILLPEYILDPDLKEKCMDYEKLVKSIESCITNKLNGIVKKI